jgi:Uma2 family endonuclease
MTLQLERTTGVKRHLVSLEEYERMCEAGVFEPETRVELLRGEIVDMPPPGPEHENAVASLHLFISELLHRRAMLWPQGNSIRLPNSNSRPQPDITLLRWRDDLYWGKRPVPEDVILLVEVSHKTVKFDKGDKLKLYAEAGIQEYWVVNIPDDVVEVYTDPGDGTYRSVRKGTRGETLQLPGELEGSIAVDDVLGKTEEF